MTSVDGGRLNTLKTAPQYAQMIKTVVKAVSAKCDISRIFNRMGIRDTFLAEYCDKIMKYAPKTIKKYLTALCHFYDFVIDEEINIVGYTTDDVLKMKVIFSQKFIQISSVFVFLFVSSTVIMPIMAKIEYN